MRTFGWTGFYESFADQLFLWNDRRKELFQTMRDFASTHELLHYLHFENREMWAERNNDIDPFTVMGVFNRGISAEHRHDLGLELAALIGLKNQEPPKDFHGIPHLDPRKSMYEGDREMWSLMAAALAGNRQEAPSKEFAQAWDKAIHVSGNALATLSMGLFWARPRRFMAVDKLSAPFIEAEYGLAEPAAKCSGQEYLDYLEALRAALDKKGDGESFQSVAFNAWREKHA